MPPTAWAQSSIAILLFSLPAQRRNNFCHERPEYEDKECVEVEDIMDFMLKFETHDRTEHMISSFLIF